jgi:hypothetical protein
MFNPGDSLSAAVTARLPELKTRIRTLIAESLEASAIAH